MIATRAALNGNEMLRSIQLSLEGVELGMQPARWIEYEPARANVLARSRPVDALLLRHPELADDVKRIAAKAAANETALRFLPVVSRHSEGVLLLAAPDMRVVGHLKADGFF